MNESTTTIKISKLYEKAGRYWLYINVLEDPLEVSQEMIVEHRLKDGIVLTRPQLEQLQHQSELARCDRQASRWLTMRDHSIGELKRKLRQKGYSDETITATVRKYRSHGMLDDAKYARALARQLLERKPAGRPYLIAHLRRKLIGRDLAEAAVDELLVEQDDVELAVRALRKRWPRLQELDLETAKQKAYTYLSRRGIRYDAAKKAFETLQSENE